MKFNKYLLSILFIVLSVITVYAFTNTSEGFDSSLVQGIEYTYAEPRKVLFVQVEGRYNQLALDSEEFLNTVYYYSITKLKLGHMPFHYAIDESGNTHKTGRHDVVQITDEPYIVVAYLSNNGQLSNKSRKAVLDITEELSYTYGLSEYQVNSISIVQAENSFSEIQLGEANTLFKDSIDLVLDDWEGYDREHKDYIAEIVSVENGEAVEVGNDLEVKVVVRNGNDFVWTSNKSPIYLSTSDSEESMFAVNEVWDSFSRATHIPSGTFVLPGDEVELTFSLDPKVAPGEHSADFALLKFDDEKFKGSEFTVEFTVEKGDQDLVRIDSPEAGYVNIRNCRRFSCEQVDVVNDGEVYPVVEYHESCWYKIRYSEDKEGWFYCPYAEEIE